MVKIAKETDELISCMKSVYSTGEDVLISKGLQYYLHIDFEVSALPQKLENAKESAQKLMFEIYESALEDPSLNRQKARSQVIKQQYKMTTQALKLQENSFEKSIMDGIDNVRDQWFQCFGAAVDCVERNLLIIEQMKDSDFRLRKENNIEILKEQCARLEGSMTRLFLKGNSLLIKCEEKRNQAEQNFNAQEDNELNELSGKLKVFEESIQKDICTIFQNIFSDMRQEFLRHFARPEVFGEFDVSRRNEPRRNTDFNIHKMRDTIERADDAKENNSENDGFTKSDKNLDLDLDLYM